MLDALEHSMSALDASVHAQRQLVADASHELRTPVTSLRTNIEILQQAQDMEPDERQRLLADVVEQIEELTLLMNDLIELARGEEPSADTEDLRLDVLVSEVVERTRRHSPTTSLLLELAPTIVTGVPARLERAVANLIDNAVKYSPPGEPVEIELSRQGADRARPRPGDLRGGPPARVRPLLPRRRGPRTPRLGAGTGDRAPGRSPARRQRHRRAGRGRRHADASAPARRRSRRTGVSHPRETSVGALSA